MLDRFMSQVRVICGIYPYHRQFENGETKSKQSGSRKGQICFPLFNVRWKYISQSRARTIGLLYFPSNEPVDRASEMGKINIVPNVHAFTCQSAHSFLQSSVIVSMIDNAAESIRALYPNPCLNVLRLSSTSRNPIGNSVYNSPKM